MTTGELYFSLLRCGRLSYQQTRLWLSDLNISNPVRDYLLTKVLHTGGFSEADWYYLLINATLLNGTVPYFMSQMSPCGGMDMRALVLYILYDGDDILCYVEDEDGSFLQDADDTFIEGSCNETLIDEFSDLDFPIIDFL